MRLSISNSKQATKADIVLVLSLCALFCAAVEFTTAHFFGRISRIEKRRESEYRAALAIHAASAGPHKPVILVAGNSLLLQGVNFPQLQQEVGPQIELHRSVFENTFYFDWYYGLRRMFRAGARPNIVALVLSPGQLTSNAIDGDYSALMMVDHKDLLRFANDIGADHNRMSVLALDNISYFFGARAEIRSWILGKLLPDLPVLTQHFHYKGSAPETSAMEEIASQRLSQLRRLGQRYGVNLILVLPPSIQDEGTAAVLKSASSLGMSVLDPISPGSLPASDYSDGFHLNAQGAFRFTPALAATLRGLVLRAAPLNVEARLHARTPVTPPVQQSMSAANPSQP